ncbi:SPFH domain-containing protein [Desulfobacterales bacterium HSG16]|nr:SPFH domain-containing protein [Desulfobacterales bacterium HSG16]
MKQKSRKEVEEFVEHQKVQLGLDAEETKQLYQQNLMDMDMEESEPLESAGSAIGNFSSPAPARKKGKKRRKAVSDPYLSESQTIRARPTRISNVKSFLYEHALPNEYIIEIGKKDAKVYMGGKFLKLGRKFLKFPATVQTVYFTSDNANKSYQGLRIDGYACWRVDSEKPEVAARSLDFTDRENPMGNTNRILRTICTEAIRHLIANITIDEALTKKDEIGRDLKSQLERIERSWGIAFDQVGIERVTILSNQVFCDLQQKMRDGLRLTAAESRMETDQKIEEKKAEHTREMEALRCQTDQETRILQATTESRIHKVELDEEAAQETEERKIKEARQKEEHESEERAEEQKAERLKRKAAREGEIEKTRNDEEYNLKIARINSDASFEIDAVKTEAKVAQAKVMSELIKIESEHDKNMKLQKLEAVRKADAYENAQKLELASLWAKLQMHNEQFESDLNEQRQKAILNQELEENRIKILKLEEQIHNMVSNNRVLARFVQKLPEIASSMKIDRYTVFDTSGGSPLSQTLAQMLSLFETQGLKRFFEEKNSDTNQEDIDISAGKLAGKSDGKSDGTSEGKSDGTSEGKSDGTSE